MNTIFDELNELFINIMYRNGGVISMDEFRSNNINNCYCFCRFNYTQEMRAPTSRFTIERQIYHQ